jgi:predicted DNA-binding transcriptional regulator AlpA
MEANSVPSGIIGSGDFRAFVDAVAKAVSEKLSAPVPQTFSQAQAIAFTGVSRTAWYRLKAMGKLPAPIRIAGSGGRWRRKDLERWLENLNTRRRA